MEVLLTINIHFWHQTERIQCIRYFNELHCKKVELGQGLCLWTLYYFIGWDALPGRGLVTPFVVS
jgi:hypothetical protein